MTASAIAKFVQYTAILKLVVLIPSKKECLVYYVISFFFVNRNFFFLLRIFTTIQKTFKSNNKNNNYINHSLKLPLLKHTHTQTHTHIHTQRKVIIIKEGNTNLPPQGISTPTTPQTEVPTAAVKE